MAVGCPNLQIYLKRGIIVGTMPGVGNIHKESESGRTIGAEGSCAVSRDMIQCL